MNVEESSFSGVVFTVSRLVGTEKVILMTDDGLIEMPLYTVNSCPANSFPATFAGNGGSNDPQTYLEF